MDHSTPLLINQLNLLSIDKSNFLSMELPILINLPYCFFYFSDKNIDMKLDKKEDKLAKQSNKLVLSTLLRIKSKVNKSRDIFTSEGEAVWKMDESRYRLLFFLQYQLVLLIVNVSSISKQPLFVKISGKIRKIGHESKNSECVKHSSTICSSAHGKVKHFIQFITYVWFYN